MSWRGNLRLFPLVALTLSAYALGRQELTPPSRGPLHVEGNRLVDSTGAPFLLRGAQVEAFRTGVPMATNEFGPLSATVFSIIRQRWNMNVVRLPLDVANSESDPHYWQAAAEVVRRANRLELAVILSAEGGNQAAFWRTCAGFFKDSPQIIFELDAAPVQERIDAIRSGGAKQPVIVRGPNPVDDANAIYQLSAPYRNLRTEQDRDREFGNLALRSPVLASGLQPPLDQNSAECASFPSDPSDAEALVEANLAYFDARGISWVASEFQPGKLIGDYQDLYPSSLENGWTCGQPAQRPAGIGEMIQFHLWGGELRGIFALSAAGGFRLPRGSVAIVYGAIFADQDRRRHQDRPPTELGKVSIPITDSQGATRLARLLYVTAGWGQANLIVPPDCALGPARLTVAGHDGSSRSVPVELVDVAPGLWTGFANGRGPVIGFAGQTPISRCNAMKCYTLPIPVAHAGATVRLLGTGMRYAAGVSDVRVMIGDVSIPVVAIGPAEAAGMDQLTIRIPPSLRSLGEADLICFIQDHPSNVVRIRIGS